MRKTLTSLFLLAPVLLFLACQNGASPDGAGQPGGPRPHLDESKATSVSFPGFEISKIGLKSNGAVIAGSKTQVRTSKDPNRVVASFSEGLRTIDINPIDGSWAITIHDETGEVYQFGNEDVRKGGFSFVEPGTGNRMHAYGAFYIGDSLYAVYRYGFVAFDPTFGTHGGYYKVWDEKDYPTATVLTPDRDIVVAFTHKEEGAVLKSGYFGLARYDLFSKYKYGTVSIGSNEDRPRFSEFSDEFISLSSGQFLSPVAGLARNGKVGMVEYTPSDTTKKNRLLFYETIKGGATAIAFHPTSRDVVSIGTADGNVALFGISKSGKLEEIQRVKVGQNRIGDVAWLSDGRKLVAGTFGKAVIYPFAVTELKKGEFGVAP